MRSLYDNNSFTQSIAVFICDRGDEAFGVRVWVAACLGFLRASSTAHMELEIFQMLAAGPFVVIQES